MDNVARARLMKKVIGNTASDLYQEAMLCEKGHYVILKFESSNPSDWRGISTNYVEEVSLSRVGLDMFLNMNPWLLDD